MHNNYLLISYLVLSTTYPMFCSVSLQLGFFSIVGIPLFKAITELFKDAQPMMDGEQHHTFECATLQVCRLQVCRLYAVLCMLRNLHNCCVFCIVLPEMTSTYRQSHLGYMHACCMLFDAH